MSLIITLYIREGIVMAADSRMTLHVGSSSEKISINFSDSTYKLFLVNNIGISTYGVSSIEGMPIAGFIESFINEDMNTIDDIYDVGDVAKRLLKYFRGIGCPKTYFHVAGYKKEDNRYAQQVWLVNVEEDTVKKVKDLPGATWGGETDILSRLIKDCGIMKDDAYKPYPQHYVLWKYFNLQDAIDFAIYAIRTTAESMRFQSRVKTVGGPIDILVIKPEKAFWIQRKSLCGGV